MGKPSKLTGRKMDSFLSGLSELVYSLPTAETKSRLDNELASLIAFLQDFQERLRSLPTGENADEVASWIESVKQYVRLAESDPLMSRVLGLSSTNVRLMPPRSSLSAEDRSEAKAVAKELLTASSQEVDRRLDKRKYSVTMLRQIAQELGMRVPSKSTRLALVRSIATNVANQRGYRALRNASDQAPVGTSVNRSGFAGD